MRHILVLLALLIISNSLIIKQKLDKAVIVEPRQHKYLVQVVKNIIFNIPEDTIVQIFHSDKNLKLIQENFKTYILRGKIKLSNIKKNNLNTEQYNQLLTSKEFWNQIDGENVLIFQTDSCICSGNKDRLNKFLHYDYVGAPWNWRRNKVGNGGFSLRKKSKMLEIIAKFKRKKNTNEDVFFSRHSINKPSLELSKKFAVESVFYQNPFGIHKPWDYYNDNTQYKNKKSLGQKITNSEYNSLFKNCNELNTIFSNEYKQRS